jgi:hypothetical protein
MKRNEARASNKKVMFYSYLVMNVIVSLIFEQCTEQMHSIARSVPSTLVCTARSD